MGMRRAQIAVVAGAGSLAVLLAGCSGTGAAIANDGPVTLGGTPSEACVSAEVGEEVGIGQPIRSEGPVAAAIEKVSVDDASGLELVGSFVVPVVDNTGTGTFRVGEGEPSPGWPMRTEAVGTSIEPGGFADLVLVLKRDSSNDGKLANVSIEYMAGPEGPYEADGTLVYKVESDCA